MAKITVGDVLVHAERFEDMLAEYYAAISSHSVRDGVRMLADYMSRHRRRIYEFLSKREPGEIQRIKRVRLPVEPEAADERCFTDSTRLPPDASASEVLDVALQLDQCLINLYRQAAEETADTEARELLEKLQVVEVRDKIRLQKIKALDYF